MGVVKWMGCPTVCALFCIAALSVQATNAAEGTAEVTKSREVTVGKTRVILLRVNQVLDFVKGDDKRPAARSVEVWYLVEQLDDSKIGPVQGGVEMFAAGTKDSAVRFLTKDVGTSTNEDYAEYEKRMFAKLPAIKAKDRGVVQSWKFNDVELKAKRVDLKLTVGLHKGEDHTVWFKGIALD